MLFDFHNFDRLRKQASFLKTARYRNQLAIQKFNTTKDDGSVSSPPPIPSADTLSVGEFWGGYDSYIWFSAEVQIPSFFTEGEIVGLFDFGIVDTLEHGAFEALFYLNGSPYQGVDANHKEIFFADSKPGDTLALQFRLWSGHHTGGTPRSSMHRIQQAEIAQLDANVDSLYYWMTALLDTHEALEEASPHKQHLLSIAGAAWNLLDTSQDMQSDTFYSSAQLAVEYIKHNLSESEKAVAVNIAWHTHIDIAWLWRKKHTREKAARSFSTVERMMERYSWYCFFQPQAQLYEDLKTDFPDLYSNIKNRVSEGRWEASGGMWVECDCNLPSGESLVRQILYGTRFFESEFQSHSRFLWLPDVFGYSAALPQILRKSEIDTFYTTKISWNDQNKLPYDTFLWRGLDGSEVLSHFITTPDPKNPHTYTYNGKPTPQSTLGVWKNYANKDLNTNLLQACGYGDGGGGPNRDMIETVERMARIPGLPKIALESVENYTHTLHQTVNDNPLGGFVPVWDGELYLEFHRGTYTSQARVKELNRKMEFLLRDAEMILCRLMIDGQDVTSRLNLLQKAWKIVLCNQFHDIIPGSSIREVYQDAEQEYAHAKSLISQATRIDDSTNSVNVQTFSFFNTTSWYRDSVVRLSGDWQHQSFFSADGVQLPSHITEQGAEILLSNMPPLSEYSLCVGADTTLSSNSPCGSNSNTQAIESPFYRVQWNAEGHLTSIYDKANSREILAAAGNVFTLHEDRPRDYDAWELEPTIDNKFIVLTQLCSVVVEPPNALYQAVDFVWQYDQSKFSQRMKLYNHSRRIDFETTVDWQQRETLLKVAFPVKIRSTKARYDIQFGSIERPTTNNTSWEFAQHEVVGHKWADFSESNYGVSLLNNCKYGYDIKNNRMRLTLLKSSSHPDYNADFGVHHFTYSLFPHNGTWHEAQVEMEAWELNTTPLLQTHTFANPFLECNNNNVVIDCIKPAEATRAIIVRLHEWKGSHCQAGLIIPFKFKHWCECNLLERNEGAGFSEAEIPLSFTPFEIKTIKLYL